MATNRFSIFFRKMVLRILLLVALEMPLFEVSLTFSIAGDEYSQAVEPFFTSEVTYGIAQKNAALMLDTSDAFSKQVEGSLGKGAFRCLFYGRGSSKLPAPVDSSIPDGYCALDHVTFLRLGCPSQISVSGDFYTVQLPIYSSDWETQGLLVGARIPEAMITSIDLPDDPFSKSRTSSGISCRSYSTALRLGYIDGDVTLPDGYFSKMNAQDASDPVHFVAPKYDERFADKYLDFSSLFPKGLTSKFMVNRDYSVILSDHDFNRVLSQTHSYYGFGIKPSTEQIGKLAKVWTDNSLMVYAPSDDNFYWRNHYLKWTNQRFQFKRLSILMSAIFLLIFGAYCYFDLDEERRDFTRLLLLGYSQRTVFHLFALPLFISCLFSASLALSFLPLTIGLINRMEYLTYQTNLIFFSWKTVGIACLLLGASLLVCSIVFSLFFAPKKRPERIKEL
jgi:hypothetical protein